jgi:hypothetical protein
MGWNWKGEPSVQVFIDSPDSLLASFASGNEPGRLILVTGPSGSGKTRWCLALADYASILGIHVGGLVSPAIFEGDLKIGIDLLDLGSGVQRRLAVRRVESSSGQITEDWHVNDETLNWGNTILGHSGGIELIAARRYRLACVVVRPTLLEIAQALWPWGEVFCVRSNHPLKAPA